MKSPLPPPSTTGPKTSRALRLLSELPSPEAHMQHRIVETLRRHQLQSVPTSQPSRNRILLRLAAALAIATVALLHHARLAPAENHAAAGPVQAGSAQIVSSSAAVPTTATFQPIVAATSQPRSLSRRPALLRAVAHFTSHAEVGSHAEIAQSSAVALVAQPLPLTHQELLLLALARSPNLLPPPDSITRSETLSNHGLGRNAILELNHEPLPQLQPASLGDFE